jgi:hypothetical protein
MGIMGKKLSSKLYIVQWGLCLWPQGPHISGMPPALRCYPTLKNISPNQTSKDGTESQRLPLKPTTRGKFLNIQCGPCYQTYNTIGLHMRTDPLKILRTVVRNPKIRPDNHAIPNTHATLVQ